MKKTKYNIKEISRLRNTMRDGEYLTWQQVADELGFKRTSMCQWIFRNYEEAKSRSYTNKKTGAVVK